MKIKVWAETQWSGCNASTEIDTEIEFGMSDEEWDNLSSTDHDVMLFEFASSLIGFSWGHSYE